jgi:hypothetical protein
MDKNTNQEQTATNVALIFANWTLDQLKNKEPEDLESRAKGFWKWDCIRLEGTINRAKENPNYDNATELTNLATGMMKIYENRPYTEINERRCEK